MRNLLIANRGEIARRIIRTARAMGIRTTAVFSDPDAGAPFVHEADAAVHLPGAAPGETYLNIAAVVAAARAAGADAVHPGYGFLSENATFARACAKAGLTFVGPRPDAIERMGSKVAAKRLMADAGVPVLPTAALGDGSGGPGEPGAPALEYPLLVKATFGGGGRGMRVVRSPSELAAAVASARREAESAFGDASVFGERYVDDPRHVEVQIFGDAHGTVVHLFERECSIQRRYQKVIEESPSPAVTPALRAELGEAAVTAARALGYVGAGTVEFVLEPDGRFWFLEVNTRLQVEHPVTEMVTGLDLVRLQLLVADGEPLPAEALHASLSGHAIDARLYAEDVAAGYLPASGTLERFSVPLGEGVRVDSGVETGSVVGTNYDAMLAKVITWAPTRAQAASRLADHLERAELLGVVTNRELLVRVLRDEEFLAGHTDTGFLSRRDAAALAAPLAGPEARARHALAAALAGQAARRSSAGVQAAVPPGWRNVFSEAQRAQFEDVTGEVEVRYRIGRAGAVDASVSGTAMEAVVRSASEDNIDIEVEGVRRTYRVAAAGGSVFVAGPDGSSTFREVERFPLPGSAAVPGSLLAPMPGTVARVTVAAGDVVHAGDALVVVEAMKMEHSVRAPHDGTVTEVRVSEGDQVDTGDVLAIVG
ncbi:MAG TPA: biotin carboxylase N-terminal domain-containing protein [Acidimicrobiales bacterium]|nr:biotin carboxylase N-terminal domain-containing protein [Acidimicrobiales bacterium]